MQQKFNLKPFEVHQTIRRAQHAYDVSSGSTTIVLFAQSRDFFFKKKIKTTSDFLLPQDIFQKLMFFLSFVNLDWVWIGRARGIHEFEF